MSKPIVINKWQSGVGESANTGFASIKNADINSYPGSVIPSYLLVKESGAVVDAEVRNIVYDPDNDSFHAVDTNGIYYKSTDSGDTWVETSGPTAGVGQEHKLVFWKGHLFSFRNNSSTQTTVDYSADGGSSWTNGWWVITHASTSTVDDIVLFGSDDNQLYIGTGNTLHSVQEKTGQVFSAASSATYTQRTNILTTLSRDVIITSITDLRDKLLIGVKGSDPDKNIATIYPWDRTSSSYNLPIHINDSGIKAMITVGSTTYFFAGSSGSLYVTNGTTAGFVKKLSKETFAIDINDSIDIFNDAIFHKDNKIYFAATKAGNVPAGIWVYNILTGSMHCEVQASGWTSTNTVHRIRSVVPIANTEQYIVGWINTDSGSTYGIDKINSSRSLALEIISPMYIVGDSRNPRTFERVEWIADRAFTGSSSDKLTISYRTENGGSWTSIRAWDATGALATDDTVADGYEKAGINGVKRIQLKIEFQSRNDVRLLEVRLI